MGYDGCALCQELHVGAQFSDRKINGAINERIKASLSSDAL